MFTKKINVGPMFIVIEVAVVDGMGWERARGEQDAGLSGPVRPVSRQPGGDGVVFMAAAPVIA